MTWVNNTTASPILTIGGADFSSEVNSITITDASIVNNGAMLTGGTVRLVELPGGHRLSDYSKNLFPRGTEVTIDLAIRGQVRRHPRGFLLVMDSSYSPEDRTIDISVGCKLTMLQNTDNRTPLNGFTTSVLPDEAGFSELMAAIQSEGAFLWQDNQGEIHKRDFFEGDGWGSNKQGASWVSVRDYTAMASAPLGSGQTPPDKIIVTYNWLEDAIDDTTSTDPDTGKAFDQDTTESIYWLEHPANIVQSQKICATVNGLLTCYNTQVTNAKQTFSVTKVDISNRYYGGPGGSTSLELRVTEGPAVELQGSYFAERYRYDLARAGNNASAVALLGLENVQQTRIEKTYEYGTGGEVIKTVERQYRNLLSAMSQRDWRATGYTYSAFTDPNNPPVVTGRGFLTEPPTDTMYLEQITTTTWKYFDDKTVEHSITLRSAARCNGVGIYPPTGERILQNIDATNNGIETQVKRTSRGGLLNPDQPPRVIAGSDKITKTAVFIEESAKYLPTSYGSIEYQTSVPYADPEHTEAQARTRAAKYGRTIRQLIEGDAAGIRVAETMRDEIFGYYPGMPFSYYDRQEGKLVKLRMNATSWGISGDSALFATDGVFIGVSNGTVNIPSNADAVAASQTLSALNQATANLTASQQVLATEQATLAEQQALLAAINDELYARIPVPAQTFSVTTSAVPANQTFVVTVA